MGKCANLKIVCLENVCHKDINKMIFSRLYINPQRNKFDFPRHITNKNINININRGFYVAI